MEHVMQGKETFFKNLKHTVSDEELLSLDQNGFVHLKRDDKFWLSNGINLDIYLEKLEIIGLEPIIFYMQNKSFAS